MSLRGSLLLAGGVALVGWGWSAGWPELSALGGGALVLVLMATVLRGSRPQADVGFEQSAVRVMRGQPATVNVSVALPRRRRWLRVTEGNVQAPLRTVALPTEGSGVLRLPVDTSKRGTRLLGPYSVVHGDPWSVTGRVVAQAAGGVLTVQPKVYPLRRSALASLVSGESSLASRRAGEDHFYALRDYVLGDEPRMVHWRSSARAGKLVVRQHLAAALSGTTIVLDADASAYSSDEQFGTSWVEERFESAVEVAASFAAALAQGRDPVHFVTTTRGASISTSQAGNATNILDILAIVDASPPLETSPEELSAIIRRTRCAHTVVVTGTPSPRTMQAVQGLRRGGTAPLVVRVGARQASTLVGMRVLDVEHAEELAH